MSYWKQEIGNCFDADSLVFAGNATSHSNACALREKVRTARLPPVVVETAFHDWLHGESSNTGRIHEQMERVREFFDS